MTARPIRDALRTLGYEEPPEALLALRRLYDGLQTACGNVLGEYARVSGDATIKVLLESLTETLRASVRIASQVEDGLYEERSKPK